MTDNERKETGQSNSIAQDSSEIFDAYNQGALKVIEGLLNFNHNMYK